MNIIQSLLDPDSEIRRLNSRLKELKERNTRLEKAEERFEDRLEKKDREIRELMRDMRKMEHDTERTIEEKEREHEYLQMSLETKYEAKENRLESIIDAAARERTEKMRQNHDHEMESLKKQFCGVREQEAAAQARNTELENYVGRVVSDRDHWREQYKNLLEVFAQKLPTVDLSKFDVNVEVPVTTLKESNKNEN